MTSCDRQFLYWCTFGSFIGAAFPYPGNLAGALLFVAALFRLDDPTPTPGEKEKE